MSVIREIIQYREMILRMVQRDLRGKYKGSVLGYLWTLISPLMQLLVYTVVFSVIMRAGYERYYYFLFVTLIPWIFFSSSVVGGTTILINQKELVNKIYFPREVLPIAHVLSQLVNMCLSMVIVIGVQLVTHEWMGFKPMMFLPVVIIIEFMMALGMTSLLAAITVFFRDIQFIVGVVMIAWQFLSPVMYGIDMVPEKFSKFFYLNPMSWVLISFRDILYYKRCPGGQQLLIACCYSLVICAVGIAVFEGLKKRFSEEL